MSKQGAINVVDSKRWFSKSLQWNWLLDSSSSAWQEVPVDHSRVSLSLASVISLQLISVAQ